MPTTPILAVRRLERRFGPVVALRGVDLDVFPSEVVLIAGPNGAGKSTLLRSVAGLSRPTRGSVRVAGNQLRDTPQARSNVGFLSHQNFLYEDLTARENLRFAAALHGFHAGEQGVMDALHAAGLTQRADTRAGVLSHGMKQRLAIARATLHRPRLLLLDEPFNGLDAPSAELLRQRLREQVASACAILCVTHQPGEVWELTTRVVVLNRGEVIRDEPRAGSLEDFIASTRELFVA